MFVKYLTRETSPWRFTFSVDELQRISTDPATVGEERTFIVLVCGPTTVCPLRYEEFANIVDVRSEDTQIVEVMFPRGGSMRVKGSRGSRPGTVPHNRFPNLVMDA